MGTVAKYKPSSFCRPLALVLALSFLFSPWKAVLAEPPRNAVDLVMVLDNSGSMKHNDPRQLSKKAALAFVQGLTEDLHMALIAFDQQVRVVLPLTPRSNASMRKLRDGLEEVDFNGLLTDIPAAIERTIFILKMSGRPEARKVILLMTDGTVDTGDASRNREKSLWLREELSLVAAQNGIQIFGIALSEQADYQLMQTLASRTKGDYYRLFSVQDIAEVLSHITQRITPPPPPDTEETDPPTVPPPQAVAVSPENQTRQTVIIPSEEPAPPIPKKTAPIPEKTAPVMTETPPEGNDAPEEEQAKKIPPAPEETLPVWREEDVPESVKTTEDEDSEPSHRWLWLIGLGLLGLLGRRVWGPSRKRSHPTTILPHPTSPEHDLPEHDLMEKREKHPWEDLRVVTNEDEIPEIVLVKETVPEEVPNPPKKEENRKEAPINRLFFAEDPQSSTQMLQPEAALRDLAQGTRGPLIEVSRQHTVIGRASHYIADHLGKVILNKPDVSRNHAAIRFKDRIFWLEDLDSANGTFLNGKRIHEKVRITHGDIIQVSEERFEFILTKEDDRSNETLMQEKDCQEKGASENSQEKSGEEG